MIDFQKYAHFVNAVTSDESKDGDLLAFENSNMKFSETLTMINNNFVESLHG